MQRLLLLSWTALLGACAIGADVGGAVSQMTQPAGASLAESTRAADEIIRSYADAWRGEEELHLDEPVTLGLWVDDVGHTVRLTNESGSYETGAPTSFDWGFETDLATLRRLDGGTLNALTAMGQARASDPIPLAPRLPEGFDDGARLRSFYIPLTSHFWNRSWPEAIPFGDGATREVHGAGTSVLVYSEGLRSAWYQLKPGMHINAEPRDQVNEFDTAIVVTRGRFRGRLDGMERVFSEGETVLVPAGMTHEFYASDGDYGEFVILMYGEGA